MPKLITTRTRIADPGKPCMITIGGGLGKSVVEKSLTGLKAKKLIFDKNNHHTLFTLLSCPWGYFIK